MPTDSSLPALIVIPARYASQRFPGKPLTGLRGAGGQVKPLIQRAWEAAVAVPGGHRVVVATDDDRIAGAAEAFGAEMVMTSQNPRNGTERCAEAHAALGGGYEVVVNLQGDAPLTPPWFVEALIEAMESDASVQMATPVLRCSQEALTQLLEDRRAGRVGGTTAVFRGDGRALYFSKEVLPHVGDPGAPPPVWHHVGVYAYRPAALTAYAGWAEGPLERAEGLEQLRFLENGTAVHCIEVEARGRAFWELNNPSDIPLIEDIMKREGIA